MPYGVAYLKGGPCDGTLRSLTQAEIDSGKLVCKGWQYDYSIVAGLTKGDETWVAIGPVALLNPGAKAAHLHSGWKDLRHSFNHDMPVSLANAHRSLAAGLRTVKRARKVRLK